MDSLPLMDSIRCHLAARLPQMSRYINLASPEFRRHVDQMMLFLLLVTTANALRLADATPRPAMKPVMKLRGGVTGVNPTILAKFVT
eukprot:scaffold50386_cov65-Phaeocystis_antarctica.AAC.5